MAFSLTFRVEDRTLQDEEVNSIIEKLIEEARQLADAGWGELSVAVNVSAVQFFNTDLAGEFTPIVPEWPKNAEMAILKVRPNNDLFDQVKVAARSKSPELRPIQIGLAYVMDKYGIDPTDAAE